MPTATKATLREILSQTQAWDQALQIVHEHRSEFNKLDLGNYEQILFIGCGSTHYLALSAAVVMQSLSGLICRGLPSSEIILTPESVLTKEQGNKLLVAVSRSGTTTETLRGVQAFREHNSGDVIAITNYGKSELAHMGDITLVIENGQEESVAQTKSFASMLVAANALACLLSGREDLFQAMNTLGRIGEQLLEQHHQKVKSIGEDRQMDQFFFLGSGHNYGLACELSLKMKEMSLSVSEPFHFMEFRHGPKAMITPSTLVVGLHSDRNYQHESVVLDEINSLQGNAFSLGETGASINFCSGLPEIIRGVLFLPLLQLMAFYRSIQKGLNPDQPRNLTAVIELDLP